jgi:hypothetical protein
MYMKFPISWRPRPHSETIPPTLGMLTGCHLRVIRKVINKNVSGTRIATVGSAVGVPTDMPFREIGACPR